MTTITILLLLALLFTFALALYLVVDSPRMGLSNDGLDPTASAAKGVLYDRYGVPRRYS